MPGRRPAISIIIMVLIFKNAWFDMMIMTTTTSRVPQHTRGSGTRWLDDDLCVAGRLAASDPPICSSAAAWKSKTIWKDLKIYFWGLLKIKHGSPHNHLGLPKNLHWFYISGEKENIFNCQTQNFLDGSNLVRFTGSNVTNHCWLPKDQRWEDLVMVVIIIIRG